MSQIKWTSVACGDTVWLAGGTNYTTELNINKTCTSSSVINIKRVLSSDSVPVAAAGWNSLFDSQVVIYNNDIDFASGAYVTVDGRQGTVAGNNYGIKVVCTVSTGCGAVGGAESGNISNMTLKYAELYGPACVTAGTCSGGADGLNVPPSTNTVSYLLVDHTWIHRWAESMRAANWSNSTIQYSTIETTAQTADEHEDTLFSYDQTNFTFRWNRVYTSPNDGMFFDGGETNTRIYGNLFYHHGGAILTFYSGFTHEVYVYNNVFENDGSYGDYSPAWLYFQGTMHGEIANNIFENVDENGSCNSICNHNAFSLGAPSGETGSFGYIKGTQFVSPTPANPANADYHLTSAGVTDFANKGKFLASPFNVDMDGNIRGADGGWDIGAYEH